MTERTGAEFQEVALGDRRRIFIVLNGLVAAGKTSLAKCIEKGLGCETIHSDVHWFEKGTEGRDKDPGIGERHNLEMLALCRAGLLKGNVIYDATTRSRAFRERLARLGDECSAVTVFVRCHCSESIALDRIKRDRTPPAEAGTGALSAHKIGNKFEYGRVKKEYEEIEFSCENVNLIDVDTERLECKILNRNKDDSAIDAVLDMIGREYIWRHCHDA